MSTIDFTWRALDTLYFGPPVSMTAGELNNGRSLFPPPPMSFQGMVRTRLLTAANPPLDLDDWSPGAVQERAQLIGGPDRLPDGWQITGPFPARLGGTVEPWFPAPRFALRGQGSRPGDAPALAHRIRSSHPGCNDLHPDVNKSRWQVGAPEQGASEPVSGWVSAGNLLWLLSGAGGWDRRGFALDLPPFVKRERRTGLAIDASTGSAMDGLLYSLETLRMEAGSGFLGRLVADLPARLPASSLTSGMGSAGRGARPVQFDLAGPLDTSWEQIRAGAHLPRDVADGAQFWLVAIAPARVEDPWAPLPAAMHGDVTCTVRAALVGPPLVLGGFSLAGRNGSESRPNRPHTPAGSAWLVELRGGDAPARRRALEGLHDKPSIGAAADQGFGFGHTLIGLYQEA